MQTTTAPNRQSRTGQPRGARRVGYVVAIGCNLLGLYIAHNLLDWGWPRFLTDQFDEVLPLITVSFVYGMATNAMLVVYDRRWFKALFDAGGAVIAFVVTVRLFQVYPFDFSDYAVDWSWLATTLLIIGLVATAVAALVQSVRVVRSLGRAEA